MLTGQLGACDSSSAASFPVICSQTTCLGRVAQRNDLASRCFGPLPCVGNWTILLVCAPLSNLREAISKIHRASSRSGRCRGAFAPALAPPGGHRGCPARVQVSRPGGSQRERWSWEVWARGKGRSKYDEIRANQTWAMGFWVDPCNISIAAQVHLATHGSPLIHLN